MFETEIQQETEIQSEVGQKTFEVELRKEGKKATRQKKGGTHKGIRIRELSQRGHKTKFKLFEFRYIHILDTRYIIRIPKTIIVPVVLSIPQRIEILIELESENHKHL